MSAPERIWIDGAVNANAWAEQKTDCTLSGVAAYEYVRADLCDPMQDERVRALVDSARRILEDIDDMKEAFDGLAGACFTTWDEMDPGGPMDAWMEGERMLRAALRDMEGGE